MVRKFIIFGNINKKYLLPFLFTLSQIINKMVNRYYPEKMRNNILESYSLSLGMMAIIFVPYIFKFGYEEIGKEKIIQKKKYLHYTLLIVIFLFYIVMKSVPMYMKADSGTGVNPFSEGPFAYIGVEMILLSITSFILLKYKYYIHHIIAIIIFIIMGNMCDLILGYYSEMIDSGWLIIFFEFISLIFDVVHYYYQKYMMEALYYPYWRICFCLGLGFFAANTILLIYVLSDKNSSFFMAQAFYYYFEDFSVGKMIGKQILVIVFSIINTELSILNIYYFNPNFLLICYQISKFVQVLIDEKAPGKYYCIIYFIVQFFSLMIYLEIIEMNFCGLNKNTKRNIQIRSDNELLKQDDRDFSIGAININKDYAIDSKNVNDDNIGNIIEMNNQVETDVS